MLILKAESPTSTGMVLMKRKWRTFSEIPVRTDRAERVLA